MMLRKHPARRRGIWARRQGTPALRLQVGSSVDHIPERKTASLQGGEVGKTRNAHRALRPVDSDYNLGIELVLREQI